MLLNECLDIGRTPETWRDCFLTLIRKGKNDVSDPAAWRGIAERNILGKLLSSLLTRRLEKHIDIKSTIPVEQHGFDINYVRSYSIR